MVKMQLFKKITKIHQDRVRLRESFEKSKQRHILTHLRLTELLCESRPAETRLAVYRWIAGPTSSSAFCHTLAVNVSVPFGFCNIEN